MSWNAQPWLRSRHDFWPSKPFGLDIAALDIPIRVSLILHCGNHILQSESYRASKQQIILNCLWPQDAQHNTLWKFLNLKIPFSQLLWKPQFCYSTVRVFFNVPVTSSYDYLIKVYANICNLHLSVCIQEKISILCNYKHAAWGQWGPKERLFHKNVAYNTDPIFPCQI